MALWKGITAVSLMFLSSYFGCVFFHGPFLLLMFISPKIYRFWMDITVALWESYTVALLTHISGIKFLLYGDKPVPGERAIIIINHRTRLDWMYLWHLLYNYGCLSEEKITLKSGLHQIPGGGWAMQCAAFLFLNRKWQHDESLITRFMNYFDKLKLCNKVLIFPEGTDLTNSSLEKSNNFARKNGKKDYQKVMHPRTTGFVHLHQLMNKSGPVAIYDVTVRYTGEFPVNEPEFLLGKTPNEVEFYIKRFLPNSSLQTSEELIDFLEQRWEIKEKFLNEIDQIEIDNNCVTLNKKRNEYSPRLYESLTKRILLIASFIFWTVFIILCFYYLFHSTWFFVGFLALNVKLCIFVYWFDLNKLVMNVVDSSTDSISS